MPALRSDTSAYRHVPALRNMGESPALGIVLHLNYQSGIVEADEAITCVSSESPDLPNSCDVVTVAASVPTCVRSLEAGGRLPFMKVRQLC